MNQGVCCNIDYYDVKAATDNIKLVMAARIDKVAMEFIKFGEQPVARVLIRVFGNVCKKNKVPAEWEYNIIIPIYTKGN